MITYKVDEIFWSVQAEGPFAGHPAVFVRFQGCNLACPWCDSKSTWGSGGFDITLDELVCRMQNVGADRTGLAVLTGGEPMLQDIEALMADEAFTKDLIWQVETNGSILPNDGSRALYVVSPKTPDPQVYRGWRNCGARHCYKIVLDDKWDAKALDEVPTSRAVYVQPQCNDDGTPKQTSVYRCMSEVEIHPKWSMSVQWHKWLGIR
jgi:7-carboxy-7-deazaguanine synthase